MHSYMYADLFAWRGTLLIVLLVEVVLVIRSLIEKEKAMPEESEKREDENGKRRSEKESS